MHSPTIRLTVAQAVITYLSRQYSVADGVRRRLVPATLGIFGHGNVAGLGQALDQLADDDAVHPGSQRAGAGPRGDRVRQAQQPARHPRRHRVHRSRRDEHGHRRGAGHGEPAPGAAAARRHLRHPSPGTGAAAAPAPHRGRPHRQRRVPPGRAVLRPDHPARAAAHRPPRRDADPRRPGRDRCRGAVAPPGRPVARLRLPRRALRRARLGDPPTRTRPGEVEAVAALLARPRSR